jgi:hypothetical protein
MGGAGGGEIVLVARGLSGWSSSNHYSHASTDTGPHLSATGGTVGVLYRLNSVPDTTTRLICSFWDGVAEGWAMYGSSGGGVLPRAFTKGAGSTNVDWPTAWVAGNVGRVFFDAWSVDGDADLEAYRQGVQVATASGTGYAIPTASSRFRIGDNAEAPDFMTIVGVGFADITRLTPAQHLAWFNSIRAAGDMVAAPAGATDTFIASAAGATWAGGTTTLTRTGSFTTVNVSMAYA